MAFLSQMSRQPPFRQVLPRLQSTKLCTAAGCDSDAAAAGMDLKIANPNAILNSIATQYESTRKILMEYVDNSLDSAEELLRQSAPRSAHSLRYPYRVCVNVDIDRRPKSRSVWIRDNCAGMNAEQVARLVSGIGNSGKRFTPWMNGQFGFGIQAFRGAAQTFDIFTTHRGLDKIYHLTIDRDLAHGIPAPTECTAAEIEANMNVQALLKLDLGNAGILRAPDIVEAHGTSICISNFDPVWFDSVTRRGMVAEIEKHFENLLNRENLCIDVSEITRSGQASVQTCLPFDYDSLHGEHVNATFTTSEGEDVECRLVITTNNVRGKRARFFKNGRCIDYVSDLRSFLAHSKYGSKLWAHPSGYIEVGSSLEPVLTRHEFRRTAVRKEVYELLYSMEEHLMRILNEVVVLETDKSMSALESVLGDSMAALLRMDQRALKEENRLDDVRTIESPAAESNNDSAEPEDTTIEHKDVTYERLRTSRRDTREKPRRGYDIQFVRTKSKTTQEEGGEEEPRSFSAGNVIYINLDHKDFVERADLDKSGRPRFSPRLAAYLANELSCHYRLGYYDKVSSEVPSERNKLYHDLFDSVYTMEDLLVKKLDTLRRHMSKGIHRDSQTS